MITKRIILSPPSNYTFQSASRNNGKLYLPIWYHSLNSYLRILKPFEEGHSSIHARVWLPTRINEYRSSVVITSWVQSFKTNMIVECNDLHIILLKKSYSQITMNYVTNCDSTLQAFLYKIGCTARFTNLVARIIKSLPFPLWTAQYKDLISFSCYTHHGLQPLNLLFFHVSWVIFTSIRPKSLATLSVDRRQCHSIHFGCCKKRNMLMKILDVRFRN